MPSFSASNLQLKESALDKANFVIVSSKCFMRLVRACHENVMMIAVCETISELCHIFSSSCSASVSSDELVANGTAICHRLYVSFMAAQRCVCHIKRLLCLLLDM